LFDAGTATGLTDRQLLERFTCRREPSSDLAFEVLILRHGPMVLRVCRNLLCNPDDAQDAFQATFLVLVKRRTSIRQIESLGGWLYGVACRVAARARVELARRRKMEERVALRIVEAVEPSVEIESDRAEIGPLVQEEVRRLPEKYRSVVVLCYWEGLTQEQAAAQLGCPLGTVRSRLARARGLLHRRITRRGFGGLAGVVSANFDGSSTSAGSVSLQLPPVPPALVHSTIQLASHVAAGRLISQLASVLTASLVQRFLWSFTMLKIGSALAAVAIVGIVGFSVTIAAQQPGKLRAAPASIPVRDQGANQGALLDQRQPNDNQAGGVENRGANQRRSEKIYSKLKGLYTIVSIVPDGSEVKKGQVICELDSEQLTDKLTTEIIAEETASANYQKARIDREISEIALVEYREGLFIHELQEIEMQIKTAEAELAIAEDECQAVRAAANKSDTLTKKRVIAELQLKKARFALELAQSRRKLLVDFTKGKRLKELQSAIEKERADEFVKKAVFERENSKRRKVEQQVEACTIRATIDGRLVYSKEQNLAPSAAMMMGQITPIIREGATVRDRQLLFEILPASDPKPPEK
jgi:RNA polymerase sigma factor (sigma-70 family)